DYVHRIGRTGRAGRSGRSFTLALPGESKALAAVTRLLGKEIPRTEIDGIAEPAAVESATAEKATPARTRTRGGRRNGRGSEARASGRDAKPVATVEPPVPAEAKIEANVEPVDEATRKPAQEPRRESGTRAAPRGRDKAPGPASRPSPSFGEHTPAFILRPVPVA
ncbi:MAG: DEAD/DEAH box helicase, partial [Pseudomonadota bacterium]